jgi:hypothetical protein
MRLSVKILMAILSLGIAILGAASCSVNPPTTWNVGCTNAVCAIISETGKIQFFDGSQKQLGATDQLPGKVTGPVAISCNAVSGNEGCVAVDATGQIWIGPVRANGTKYQLITTIPK